jgi:hypothetical protein
MATKLTRLTDKIAIQLDLVAESCTICSSRSRRPVRKLLDTPSYIAKKLWNCVHILCYKIIKCTETELFLTWMPYINENSIKFLRYNWAGMLLFKIHMLHARGDKNVMQSLDVRIILKYMLNKQGVWVWNGFTLFMIIRNKWLRWQRQWTSGLHNAWGIQWVPEWLSAFQEWFCLTELVKINIY